LTIVSGRNKVVLKLSPRGRIVLAFRPKKYPLTRQQIRVKECAVKCNIRKGMARSELVEKMGSCIRPCMTGPAGLEREIRMARDARAKVRAAIGREFMTREARDAFERKRQAQSEQDAANFKRHFDSRTRERDEARGKKKRKKD